MEAVKNLKKVAYLGKKGFNEFMFVNSEQKNESLNIKIDNLEKELESSRKEKEAVKAERKEARKEKIERFKKFLSRDEEEEDYGYFDDFDNLDNDVPGKAKYWSNGERYRCKEIGIECLRDANLKKFNVNLRGQDLLKRNLEASKIFIQDEDDFLRVNRIVEVEKEINQADLVFLMLETSKENYVILFNVTRSF